MAGSETRRDFLEMAAATALAGSLVRPVVASEGKPRKRIAILTTLWAYLRHGQHIGDRFLVGYPWEGEWHRPEVEVVSAHVAQAPTAADMQSREAEYGFPQGDLAPDRARQFGFGLYSTIAGALRCGGDSLAVDGVVIIAEHGEYPYNEKGQHLYPRADIFRQVVDVFDTDGKSVPVFNDKHLSYDFRKAEAMVDASRRLGFPMLAGSSLPVTWRMPEMEVPLGARISEAVAIGTSTSLDSSGFHALEGLQCLVERRKGGETGIETVQLLEGDAVWKAMHDRRWSHELMSRALSRSDLVEGITLVDARTQDLAAPGVLEEIVTDPKAVLVRYRDGLQATLLMLPGATGDYTAAVRIDNRDEVLSTKFLLPPNPNVAYSACLAHHIEQLIVTGRPNYPVERTLLVSGLLEAAHDSRVDGHRLQQTPHLAVRYHAPRQSQYCRS
jgi:hypothetical protein